MGKVNRKVLRVFERMAEIIQIEGYNRLKILKMMRSNISGNFNSIDLASNSNRDINYLSSMKVSQRLDSRLKSVMPELKGKTSQIYLTIKAHKSLQDSKGNFIRQIKQQLQIPTNLQQGEISLNNYIQWSTFDETKQLLKDQYLDNELYYIIVPQKHLSWAQTFARQQRADSQNKKKIHVLGIVKESLYKQKLKAKSKKRIDKQPDYVHYYSLQNQQSSRQIFQLISQHLQEKLRQEDQHIKNWALSNKYAEKKIKRRTVHIYFDNADRATLENLYKKYNPKSRSSWLQIHPYSSFYDIVKSIKQREALNIKEADKAQQMAQQLTSKLIQSRSQIELGSMKSLAVLDNSQLFSSSVQAVTKLNKDDVNVIICRTDFEQLDKLVAFVKAQKLRNWQLVQINTDSPNFYQKMTEIFEVGKNFQKQYEEQKEERIIKSKTLYIISQVNDEFTKELFYRQDNVFHNMELLIYNNITDFAILLREGVKSKDNYTVAVVPGGVNTVDYEYEKEIKEFMKQYKNTEVIDNFTFVSTANGMHASLLSATYQNDLNVSRVYHLANNDQSWLQRIMLDRDTFFHPFKGLKGAHVYLLVKSTKESLLSELRDYISQSPRLQISTYIDKEYLAKQLQNIQIKDSAIVVTDDDCLREAQQVLVKFDQAFIMNITSRKNLKEEVKVFAWGDKQRVFELIKMIPEMDHKLESEIYIDKPNKISEVRQNRFLPKKIPFLPGNTIVVRLPADLTDQESRKMQIRLKKYFNEQIKIEYYKDPKDIRMRNKALEPLTFVILREKELEYMKTIAKKQIEEKREEFILYHENPTNFRYLIEKPEFQRFRFISNSWPDIEDYIIRTFGLYIDKDITESIYEDQFIHVFVERLPCEISDWIERYVDRAQLKAANNTRFYLKGDLEDVVLMYPSNHRFYYVIEESMTQNDALAKRKIGEQALQVCKFIDSSKKLEFIILSSNRQNVRNSDNSVKCVQPDQKSVADWIASIKVIKVDCLNSRPYILIDRNSMDWFYFLDKYSKLTGRFRFQYTTSKDDMRKTIERIRNNEPAEEIWILVKSLREANECGRIAEKIESGRNVSIIYHGDEGQTDQRKKIIFGHGDRIEVQKFILNPFRRSHYEYFPSCVFNQKVMLAPVNSTYRQFKTIPLNQREVNNWKKLLNADIRYCTDVYDLMRLGRQNSDTTIYAILDSNIEQQNRIDLENAPNIKRIILNMNPTFNPRALRNNFKLSNKEIFEAAYPGEISQELKYLRYNIRNPETQIQKRYQKQLTEIYMLKNVQVNDVHVLRYIEKKNDSIVKIKVFEPNKLQDSLDRASNFDYNTIFVGDNTVASAVNERNRKTNTKFKFINAKAIPPYQANGPELQTNQIDEIKMYLYNLPEKRFDRAKNFNGRFRLFYDVKNQNKQFLDVIENFKKVSLRNNGVELKPYEDPKKLNVQIKEPSFIVIQAADEPQYQNLLKLNNNVQYLILNEDQNRNFSSYGNKFFVNKNNVEYYHFFNNLLEFYGGNLEPLPLKLDISMDRVFRNLQNFVSEPMMDERYSKLKLNPPFTPMGVQPTRLLDPIPFSMSMLDPHPPTLKNIPLAVASPPTLALGLKWLQKIKSCRLMQTTELRPLTAPTLDIPPCEISYKITSEPDRNYPTLSVEPKCPVPQVKRYHMAALFLDAPEYRSMAQMLKSNLEPEQFTVKLIPFRNEHELDEYARGNASKLNSFDKIVVLLSPEYKKYDNILKVMKTKLDPRMEYFFFDDNFHQENLPTLAGLLKPYKMKKIKTPFENLTGSKNSKFWNNQQNFNIFVPSKNGKYDNLKSQNVNVYPYNNKQDIQEYLHRNGFFNIIVCDRASYHSFKDFPKVSPRCILVVEDTADLYDDELLFYRFPQYSIYYGPNGAQYLKKTLPRSFPLKSETVKMLYFSPADKDLALAYPQYEKVQFKAQLQLYENIVIKYGLTDYTHWLLKNSPLPELISLHPKVYLEDKDYMKDFKNNYIEAGYKHKGENLSMIRSQIRIHEFADLHEYFYKDHKHLTQILQSEQSPCVVLINGSSNKLMGVKQKFGSRHKFVTIVNDSERWIDKDGYLLEVQDYILRKKQDLFLNVFSEKVFDSFNDFQYYYLSNKADVDRKFNIYFRTKQDLEQICERNPNLLMVIFVQSCDKKHIPNSLLQQSHTEGGRVKIVYIQSEFVDDDIDLYVKFNEIDPVIYHINRIEFAGRRDYIVFREIDGDKKRRAVIMQNKLQNVDSKPYNSMDDIDRIGDELKGQYKKIYVVCFPDEQEDIERAFEKYSIKNKPYSNEAVEYFYIDQVSTINPTSNIMMNSNGASSRVNELSPRSPKKSITSSEAKSPSKNTPNGKIAAYTPMPMIAEGNSEHLDSNLKIEKIIENKNFTLSINEKLKNKLPIGKFYARNIEYFNDVNELKKNNSGIPQLIISNEKLNALQAACEKLPSALVVYVSNDKKNIPTKNVKSPNTLIITEEQVPTLIKKLQGQYDNDQLYDDIDPYEEEPQEYKSNNNNNYEYGYQSPQSDFSMKSIDDYEKIRIIYDQTVDPEEKRKLLAASVKNKKIFPTKFKDLSTLTEYMKQPNSLVMLMMDKEPLGLEKKVNSEDYKIVRKKKMRMLLPKRSDDGIQGLETILEEDENDNEHVNAVQNLSDEEIQIYLNLIERKPTEQRAMLFDFGRQKSKSSIRKEELIEEDQITKLNVHSNIRPQDIKLFGDDQIEKIKQRLDGNLIVLVIEHSKKDEVKDITNKYNILVQNYTNALNLQNDLRDRKDSVTIAVINKKMIEKIIPLKKKYKQVTFILENDTPQQELLETYKPYIAGQIKKMSDLQKIIAELYSQNERIRYNEHSIRLASRFENKRPSVSVVDYSNNQKLSNAINNQKSKKAFLFYKEPQNTHLKIKLLNDVGHVVSFIPYKNVVGLKTILGKYNSYSSIVIANGEEIPEIEDFISKRKENVFVIRFNAPQDCRDTPKVKKLFSTYKKTDLQDYLYAEFMKIGNISSYQRLGSKFGSPIQKNIEVKKYTQKYQPNAFGTTPRFPGDFVPPKSMKETYSHRYMKSQSRSKMGRDDSLKSKNLYYQS